MNSRLPIAAVLALVVCAGATIAQEEFDPVPVIEGRQSALRDIGAAFKGITDEFRKPHPSLPAIRQYSKQIDDLVKQQKFWFPPGTGPETEIEMKAKAEIWKRPAEFRAGQAALSEQAAKLAQLAAGEDLGAIRSQWQTLGKVCKGCHEKFREEDD